MIETKRADAPASSTDHLHDATIEEIIMTETRRPSTFLSWLVLALTVLVCVVTTLLLSAVATAKAGEAAATPLAAVNPQIVEWGLVAAALSTALAATGAGYAVARVGSAAIGAIAEKPELFGRALVLVGLAEGIAIYGLIVSILILNRIA
jgi:V/A-type H+-transporting ATPase subunit K